MACRTVVVDDAHRTETFGKVLQILQDTANHRNLKLVVSTRPGSATRLTQHVFLKVDPSQVTRLPELQELNREESRALAIQVLGDEFRNFASHLAEIGSNSPFVIVAGGRLIATRKNKPHCVDNIAGISVNHLQWFPRRDGYERPEIRYQPAAASTASHRSSGPGRCGKA